MDFNDIFSEDLAFDHIKSHKKQGFVLSVEKNTFQKTTGWGGGGGGEIFLGLI